MCTLDGLLVNYGISCILIDYNIIFLFSLFSLNLYILILIQSLKMLKVKSSILIFSYFRIHINNYYIGLIKKLTIKIHSFCIIYAINVLIFHNLVILIHVPLDLKINNTKLRIIAIKIVFV